MNKFILAFAGAMALSLTANASASGVVIGYGSNPDEAEPWFDGGIEDGWPEKATGGGWDNTNGTTYAEDKLTVSAAVEAPLTFTAAVEKVTADYTAKISSEVGFTAFETLPQVPADAKAGVIVYGGTYWALKLDTTTNNWANTGIPVVDGAVAIDVTFLETNKVVYVIDGKHVVTNTVKTVESVQNVCMSGDGTLANLVATVESKAKPVVPGADIPVPQGKTQEQFITDINNNPVEKAKYLKAPDGAKTTEAYLSLFNAAPNGDKVTFVLNDTGTNKVVEASTDAKTNVLAVALSGGDTFTITSPIRGFYYSFKQGGEVTNLIFQAETDKNQLATETKDPSFKLIKHEDKGFYNTLVTPAPYVEPQDDSLMPHGH